MRLVFVDKFEVRIAKLQTLVTTANKAKNDSTASKLVLQNFGTQSHIVLCNGIHAPCGLIDSSNRAEYLHWNGWQNGTSFSSYEVISCIIINSKNTGKFSKLLNKLRAFIIYSHVKLKAH